MARAVNIYIDSCGPLPDKSPFLSRKTRYVRVWVFCRRTTSGYKQPARTWFIYGHPSRGLIEMRPFSTQPKRFGHFQVNRIRSTGARFSLFLSIPTLNWTKRRETKDAKVAFLFLPFGTMRGGRDSFDNEVCRRYFKRRNQGDWVI